MKSLAIGKICCLILRYTNTSIRRLNLTKRRIEVLLEKSKEQSTEPTVMITTDCNETFASVNQIDVNLVDFLRVHQKQLQDLQRQVLLNLDLVNDILESKQKNLLRKTEILMENL